MEFHVMVHFKGWEVVAVFPAEVVKAVCSPGSGSNVGYDSSSANSNHPH